MRNINFGHPPQRFGNMESPSALTGKLVLSMAKGLSCSGPVSSNQEGSERADLVTGNLRSVSLRVMREKHGIVRFNFSWRGRKRKRRWESARPVVEITYTCTGSRWKGSINYPRTCFQCAIRSDELKQEQKRLA